jgi:hypothetical protein
MFDEEKVNTLLIIEKKIVDEKEIIRTSWRI